VIRLAKGIAKGSDKMRALANQNDRLILFQRKNN
jgi:hypothetical protein